MMSLRRMIQCYPILCFIFVLIFTEPPSLIGRTLSHTTGAAKLSDCMHNMNYNMYYHVQCT